MSIVTGQQLTRYYDQYKSIDVTFTKEVHRATGLLSQQVHLKCLGDSWPCIVYSASMTSSKIIIQLVPNLIEKLKKSNNLVSLRFCFKVQDKQDPMSFFVAAKITATAPYTSASPNLYFLTLSFTQRPTDYLIEILGTLLEANVNSHKRKEDRIIITTDSMRKLVLRSKDTLVYIENVPRRCIIRDLSFSGLKVLVMGIGKFLVNKTCTVRLEFDEGRTLFDLQGLIVRYEEVEGRKDISALAIKYDEQRIPMEYKMRINDYLNQLRVNPALQPQIKPEKQAGTERRTQEQKAAPETRKPQPESEPEDFSLPD